MVRGNEPSPSRASVSCCANLIPQGAEFLLDHPPSIASIVALEVPDVLHDDVLWSVPPQDLYDLMKERPTRLVFEPVLGARLRKRLAREARAQYVMIRDRVLGPIGSDVSFDRFAAWEVFVVEVPELGVDLGGVHTFVPQTCERSVEAAEASEEVDEPEPPTHHYGSGVHMESGHGAP
jgi:hypothetical protein